VQVAGSGVEAAMALLEGESAGADSLASSLREHRGERVHQRA
jgi:hypothetical protein